jgi:dolichol-phosphate mannosyltransferase
LAGFFFSRTIRAYFFKGFFMSAMLSVVVPMLNEEENVNPLLDEIVSATKNLPLKDIIFVNDGSTDRTLSVMQEAKKRVSQLRIITHSKRLGQSASVATGVRFAAGDIVVTLDGDGQNNPADIPAMYRLYDVQTQASMVMGQRFKRHDSKLRIFSTKIANGVRSTLLKDNTRDSACGLKMFPRDAFLRAPYFNHMHRFMPAIMKREGLNIVLVPVHHRPRERGISKYGLWDRIWVGIIDLFGVLWLIKRGPDTTITRTEV